MEKQPIILWGKPVLEWYRAVFILLGIGAAILGALNVVAYIFVNHI